jgi:hypothetical protein
MNPIIYHMSITTHYPNFVTAIFTSKPKSYVDYVNNDFTKFHSIKHSSQWLPFFKRPESNTHFVIGSKQVYHIMETTFIFLAARSRPKYSVVTTIVKERILRAFCLACI